MCEFLNMDAEFIARAFEIRNTITPDKTEKRLYAKAVPDMPLDVHHIKHQSIADCSDIIDGVHKDAKCNLVALCKQCHVKVYKNQIEIFGYKQTMKLVFDDF